MYNCLITSSLKFLEKLTIKKIFVLISVVYTKIENNFGVNEIYTIKFMELFSFTIYECMDMNQIAIYENVENDLHNSM